MICNEDWHFGNFGLLGNNYIGELFAPAHIFDNNLSLFNLVMDEDLKDIEVYAKTRTTPYGISFETICEEVIEKTDLTVA